MTLLLQQQLSLPAVVASAKDKKISEAHLSLDQKPNKHVPAREGLLLRCHYRLELLVSSLMRRQ
ncbi:hypothetical protein [Cognatiyoonia sp. IB215182]|uniref:hypothetical protein n=1 Tax=Cognatiyoonia sp. IB215182 TaxID=3097353 RepID=UPI002A0C6BCE|nr:hypothetical protein [Cognatiyoonia sp. IB215182]MDX8355802.1 hypothetical protein [Cognatiyoonia sp. IB215182]